ncbi:MAG TPA: HAD family hydrolase [Chthoniobacter sp.]|nr:HAD family hydrolase [Chthoniobacter sp.]
MLVIFDVDGTLIGGEAADWLSFDTAIESVLGFAADATFFAGVSEITAQSIAEAAVRASGAETGSGLEQRIRDEYFRGLRLAHSSDPLTFQPRPGVPELLQHLTSIPGVKVALATGDWHPTITFKLAAAGIDISNLPIATSSDTPRRADIIRLAAERAGMPLSQAVYVGDGPWDMRACRELDLAFIGTGARTDRLSESGVQHLLEPLEPVAFISLLRTLGLTRHLPHFETQSAI